MLMTEWRLFTAIVARYYTDDRMMGVIARDVVTGPGVASVYPLGEPQFRSVSWHWKKSETSRPSKTRVQIPGGGMVFKPNHLAVGNS